jgi:hypothetical protein
MIRTDSEHCRIVIDSLAGERQVDERTFDSLTALNERLERLKKFDEMFSGIQFSSAVKKLLSQKSPLTVS